MGTGIVYGILGVYGFCTFLKVITSKQDGFVTVILNLLFGGTLFIILNICGLQIKLNLLSGACIIFGGVPGVLLLIIIKIFLGI